MINLSEILPATLDDLPDDDYHAMGDYLNSSRLKVLAMQSPLHFISAENKDTPAMEFGRLAHALIADPAHLMANNEIIDVSTKTTKAYKEAKLRSPGHVYLQRDVSRALEIIDRVRSDPFVAPLLADAKHEVSWFWREQGRLARARTDVVQPSGDVSDFKFVASASPRAVRRAVTDYGWHLSVEWYRRGMAANGVIMRDWYWICAEKEPPFAVQVYHCAPEWLAIASAQIDRALHQLAACEAANHWPSYSDGIHHLGVPEWLAGIEE